MDMRIANWIVSLFMELADPTQEQRLIATSLFMAEIDHQLEASCNVDYGLRA